MKSENNQFLLKKLPNKTQKETTLNIRAKKLTAKERYTRV